MTHELYRPFTPLFRASFLERPNRFVVLCQLEGSGEVTQAYLPNPGRLRELLLPGVGLQLVERAPESTARMRYTVVGVDRRGARGLRPIMLHTHRTNDVARLLIEAGRVPGLESAEVVAAEHTLGHSRFDFLLEQDGQPLLLEVKSCTLVGGRVAMFPDAVTQRGARHVTELAELARGGRRAAVLFVVGWPEARLFSPDYHTDLAFSRALLEARHDVEIIALAVGWTRELALGPTVRRCEIPWEVIEAEAQDRGAYFILLELPAAQTFEVGALGELDLRAGFYVYVGSAMRALSKRVERHRRRRKQRHWHIDSLRERALFHEALPIRGSERLECELAAAVRAKADWTVARFGASDCGCGGHLFGFAGDPRKARAFQDLVLRFRMAALERLTPLSRR
jgi:sugar fermentation stimulation protein A